MAGQQKKGGGSKKYGRNGRAPSNANQTLRTAKNKRLRIEKEARRKTNPKKLNKPRGTARAKRRMHLGVTKQVVVPG